MSNLGLLALVQSPNVMRVQDLEVAKSAHVAHHSFADEWIDADFEDRMVVADTFQAEDIADQGARKDHLAREVRILEAEDPGGMVDRKRRTIAWAAGMDLFRRAHKPLVLARKLALAPRPA